MERSDTTDSAIAITCLLAALTDVQNTVRAFDTKAQIVGISYIFSLGLIINLGSRAIDETLIAPLWFIVVLLIIVWPVFMFGLVLYPSGIPFKELGSTSKPLQNAFFFSSNRGLTLEGFLTNIDAADWQTEIAYEIMRVSALRDQKRTRFLRALYAAGMSYIVLFIELLIGALLNT